MCETAVCNYIDGYVEGVDAVLEVVADYLSEDIIDHIKKDKRLEYYKDWKKQQ